VCHPVAGVAGRNVHIICIKRILPHEGKTIYGFHYSAPDQRYSIRSVIGNRSRVHASSRPYRSFRVIFLPGLMVFTADDQDIITATA
jgi:hypothetical protein